MGLIDFIKDLNVSECTKRGIAGVMLGSTTGIAVGFGVFPFLISFVIFFFECYCHYAFTTIVGFP